ncbi:MAG TPA: AmmeMemoRadiSam system protein B [Verrucomicrobiae bacterium]|nr:AmmeMemoRadiSam system protein B [Verrucomicrobiae bacterium]
MKLIAILISIFPLVAGLTGATTPSPLSVSIPADGFVDQALFRASWSAHPWPEPACTAFRAGVVNHHALAADLLAGFFRTLRICEPGIDHFIILSPDHFGAAHASVATHELAYRSAGEDVAADPTSTRRLLAALPFAVDQPEMFTREHGIGALIPFLGHEFPHARVTAVAVKSSISSSERAALAAWLADELARPRTFVIVSSDMSHYLPEEQALINDGKTKAAFSASDKNFFASASDDYTDNGSSITAVLSALGKTKWTLLQESISSRYGGSSGYTTSYLVGLWR